MKYHQGFSLDIEIEGGLMNLVLAFNPFLSRDCRSGRDGFGAGPFRPDG